MLTASSTSSALAYLPFPNIATYSASKAAMHFYTMCLRDQLRRAKSPCLVAELYPPVVQSTATTLLIYA